MPLLEGRSQDTINRNIDEMLRSYERTGKIGRITPKNKAHARRIASKIAYTKAGRSSSATKRKTTRNRSNK
jgi:hypothetical protein